MKQAYALLYFAKGLCIIKYKKTFILFQRSMSQAAALARIFGECREGRCVPAAHVQRRPKRSAGQIPRPLGPKVQAKPCPVACCGVFDFRGCKICLAGI